MEQELVNSTGDLNIIASENSSAADFDFLVGKWNIHNRKLKKRLQKCDEWTEFEAHQECRKILQGFGNTDHFHAEVNGKPFEGMTLRLFNPQTKLWSIYWADSNAVVLDTPVAGSFDGNIGRFFSRSAWEGKNVIEQYQWDKTNAEIPVWSQALSIDEGKTWEWNWQMTMRKRQ
jgi:hypothetical protein